MQDKPFQRSCICRNTLIPYPYIGNTVSVRYIIIRSFRLLLQISSFPSKR